jgi:hypothetical protein
MSEATFDLVPSVTPFVQCENFTSLIVGPVGSTKTTAGIAKIAYHAKLMAPCIDGVRRSRCVWVRNTKEQLRDTSIPDFTKWYPDGEAGAYLKTEMKFTLRFDDVECEVLFRGLDDANDVRRLLSLQISFGILEEFREINPSIYEQLGTRVGRYPDGTMVPHRPEWGVDSKGNPIQGCVTDEGKPNKHLWGMTNPPDYDTFWEQLLSDPPANVSVFIQPSGLSPEADWQHFLPTDYYENLAEGKGEDWVDVYVHAKFGKSLAGKPVFRSFSREIHVAKSAVKANRLSANPILVGFDCTGVHPAAVIGQVGFNARLMVFNAIYGDDKGPLRFVREDLKPLLANQYAGMNIMVILDPAAIARNADERSTMEIIKAEGLPVKLARTNNLQPRISAVEQFLTRMVDGLPGLAIDPTGASLLVSALSGKYRFKLNSKGVAEDTPEKLHPWSDVVDAFQYLCLHADGGQMFGAQVGGGRREVKPPPRRWAL